MTKKELGQKARKYFEAKEAGKTAYDEADQALQEISQELAPGDKIQLFDEAGKPAGEAELVDQFAKKSIVWKPCGVRRFDLKMV